MAFSGSRPWNHSRQPEAGAQNPRQRSQGRLQGTSQLNPVDGGPPNATHAFEGRQAVRENEMMTPETGPPSMDELGFPASYSLDDVQNQNVRQAERPFALPGLAGPEGPFTDWLTSVQNPPPWSWPQVRYDGNNLNFSQPDTYYYDAIVTCALTGCQQCQYWWRVLYSGNDEDILTVVPQIDGIASGAYFQAVRDDPDCGSQQGDSLAVMVPPTAESAQSNAGLDSFDHGASRRSSPQDIGRPSGPSFMVWNLRTGEQAPVIPDRNRRTPDERDQTHMIRLTGGACDNCRSTHRRCSLGHPAGAQTPRRARREVEARWQEDTAAMGAQFSDSI